MGCVLNILQHILVVSKTLLQWNSEDLDFTREGPGWGTGMLLVSLRDSTHVKYFHLTWGIHEETSFLQSIF